MVKKREYLGMLFLGIVVMGVYMLTASKAIGWIDAGTIAAAAKTLGIPNPPGFPLYMMVANLFTRLPVMTVLWRLQLLSQLSALVILGLVYFLVKKITGNILASLAAMSALGFSYSLWSQAVNVETYTLSNAMLLIILVAVVAIRENWKKLANKRDELNKKGVFLILILGLVSGLATGLNPTVVVGLTILIWWVVVDWERLTKNWKVAVLGVFLALAGMVVVYSYLPVRAMTNPFVNWGDPRNKERLLAHLVGKGLDIYEPETNSINGFTGEPTVMLASFGHFWYQAFFQFTPLLFPLVIYGWWKLKKIRPDLWLVSSLTVLANLLIVVLYYGGNQESWMITSWMMMAVWMGVGMGEIMDSRLRGNDKVWIILVGVGMVPLLFWFPMVNRSKDNFATEYADNMYKEVPEGSVIVGGGDFFNSLTAYTHEVTGQRKDIIPITGNMFYIFPWYRENLRKNTSIKISQELEDLIKFKSVDEFTNAIDKLVEDNPDRQVFVTPLLLRDTVVAGHKEGNYHTQKYDLVPHGLLLKVVPKGLPVPPREDLLTNISFGKAPFYLERNYKNAYKLLRNDYAVAALNLGEYWWQRQEVQKAGDYFNEAMELGSPEAPDFVHRMAIFYAQIGQKDQAKNYFEKALALVPDDSVIKQNYQNFLGEKPVEPEIERVQEEMTEYKTKSIAFKYPKDWKVSRNDQGVKLEEKEGKMTMEIMTEKRSANVSIEEYLGKKLPLSEKLVNQGLAKIPSFDLAYVKIWEAEVIKMQFFLFKADLVVEMVVWPGDSPLMRTFDQVVSSIVVL